MNFLAHAYLSFDDINILTGNMISDFVKGKKQYDYPLAIQKGIQLHRAIDSFTDNHPASKEAKHFFKPAVGLYAAAFVDVVYDHFLALDELELTADEWEIFVSTTYKRLQINQSFFPEKFSGMFPYMQSQNWLYNYKFTWGVEKSFGGVVRRAKYLKDSTAAFAAFLDNYTALGHLYKVFFPDLKKFASTNYVQLMES
jgi:acyl carrier protein phosphodiesterase